MAIVAFHFSGVYKDALLNKKKDASVMIGNHLYENNSEVLVYLSETPNLFDDSPNEKRIGNAKIKTTRVCKLDNLSDKEAQHCGYDSKLTLVKEMKCWFPKLKDDDTVTYVEFDLSLF